MVIVAGTFRVPVEAIEALLPVASATLAATRAEAGCLTYSYAFDVEDRGLVRVNEEWETRADLDRHSQAPHMAPWRAALKAAGMSGRSIRVHEAAGPGEPV